MNKNILVVDDELMIRNVLQKFLTTKGYSVRTVADGQSALEEYKKQKPDIILLDIMMPGLSGIETFFKIKEIDPDAKVLIVSGITDEDIGKKILSKGGVDYIPKPFDLRYLATSIFVNTFI